MPGTGLDIFETTIDKTNHVLKVIEGAYGWPKRRRRQSYEALRAVLHALRDRLQVTEASELAAQLPLLIKGIYYEGWRPERTPQKMNRDEFLARIRSELSFEPEGSTEVLVETVFAALEKYIAGELKDVKSTLPDGIASLLP